MKKINTLIQGACGRMGRSIAALTKKDDNFDMVFPAEHENHESLEKDFSEVTGIFVKSVSVGIITSFPPENIDVVVDFSNPEACMAALDYACENKIPFVSGTTGLSNENKKQLEEASKKIPLIHSSNMSQGVNVLFYVLEKAAELTCAFDSEIIEKHHNRKQDAPSGTAISLAKIVAEARKKNLSEIEKNGRSGISPRNKDEIGIHAVRGGTITGEHTVIFAGQNETIELTHRAQNREIFADGALAAAKWLAGRQKPGFYSMRHVLGL